MGVVWAIIGLVLIIIMLWDAFETVVFPRRVTRRLRLARLFYRYTWLSYSWVVSKTLPARRQEAFLSYFGPLSLLALIGIWAAGLVTGYAFLFRAVSLLHDPLGAPEFVRTLYFSGTTFFTLGMGDVTPSSTAARILAVFEVGMGFAFLALIIGYLPSLNQSFSHREVSISLLDARAGSPPTAAEMLRRHAGGYGMEALRQLLHEWELWSAELLESHLSYPVLAYFRSQHDNQSWLAALTAILDTCALSIAGTKGACLHQAKRTFAVSRHAAVDLAIIFDAPPRTPEQDRLPDAAFKKLRSLLAQAGLNMHGGPDAGRRLADLRAMYEPYVNSLARLMHLAVPPFMMPDGRKDNWQTSPWDTISSGTGVKGAPIHF
ncbi:MAG: metal transporter [Spirochaetes bacterium RBG_16_49_21]|nr:MAG: metal transporter [Spirochaetes bacterium RBG_16_49_21]